MSDLDGFLAELDRIDAGIPRAIENLAAALAVVGYEDVINHSPVLTGAYRAEHVIGAGEGEHPTSLLYEPPNRPGPDTIVKLGGGQPLGPPNVGDAKAALGNVEPFEVITLLNQRFYAGFLEHGSATTAPRLIYTLAADRLSGIAANVKLELPGVEG